MPRRAELLERLGVPSWHAQGWRGQGLKVAVLDSSFQGYREHLGAALPKSVQACSFRFDGDLEAKNSPHGILCAEVIHALAPDAELLLANWEPEHPEQFLAAVRWARQRGARIISCSIIMPSWSDGEGHGRIHEEMRRLLAPLNVVGNEGKAGDALFFASAGNTAQRHWSGPFEDNGDGYHVWKNASGAAYRENVIRPWGGERVSVELCCLGMSTYEVTVSEVATEKIVVRAQSRDGDMDGSIVAAFMPEPGCEYHVRIRRLKNAGAKETPPPFHLTVLGGSLRHFTSEGSIPFPGDGCEVIAVGAVDASGRRLAYSSCGPKHAASKPDLVAIVPFPSCWRARPFAGTSAAAPQAAALAALLWSRHPDWNAQQIRNALQEAARPCPVSSPAWEIGRGLLQLPSPN